MIDTSNDAIYFTGGAMARTAEDGEDFSPVPSKAYVSSVLLHPKPIAAVAVLNGSRVAGNLRVALANGNGRILYQSEAAPQAGADSYQLIVLPALLTPPQWMDAWLCVAADSPDARLRAHRIGIFPTGSISFFGGFVDFTPPSEFQAGAGVMGAISVGIQPQDPAA